jgi:hypothetical protein
MVVDGSCAWPSRQEREREGAAPHQRHSMMKSSFGVRGALKARALHSYGARSCRSPSAIEQRCTDVARRGVRQ